MKENLVVINVCIQGIYTKVRMDTQIVMPHTAHIGCVWRGLMRTQRIMKRWNDGVLLICNPDCADMAV